jgi:hypothetical protein
MSLIMRNRNKAKLLQHLAITKFEFANKLRTPAEQVCPGLELCEHTTKFKKFEQGDQQCRYAHHSNYESSAI